MENYPIEGWRLAKRKLSLGLVACGLVFFSDTGIYNDPIEQRLSISQTATAEKPAPSAQEGVKIIRENIADKSNAHALNGSIVETFKDKNGEQIERIFAHPVVITGENSFEDFNDIRDYRGRVYMVRCGAKGAPVIESVKITDKMKLVLNNPEQPLAEGYIQLTNLDHSLSSNNWAYEFVPVSKQLTHFTLG